MPTVSASENPELATRLVEQALAEASAPVEEQAPEIEISPLPETVFTLPGGYYGPDGFTAQEFEVRELTGRDEEAISRARSTVAVTDQILKRGLVRVGDRKPDDMMLNNLLAGDREYILLQVFASTFGSEVTAKRTCPGCQEDVEIKIDVQKDVPVRTLESPRDRNFTVECRGGVAQVSLPTGVTQRLIQEAENKNLSELSTILLANTVDDVAGRPVLTEADVLDLPIRDRRKIADEIARRTPGPRLMETKASCPLCEHEVEVPLSMGSLFQF